MKCRKDLEWYSSDIQRKNNNDNERKKRNVSSSIIAWQQKQIKREIDLRKRMEWKKKTDANIGSGTDFCSTRYTTDWLWGAHRADWKKCSRAIVVVARPTDHCADAKKAANIFRPVQMISFDSVANTNGKNEELQFSAEEIKPLQGIRKQ